MIDRWLEKFHHAWQAHDINGVLDLFTNDVEYWETPHKQLHGKDAVRQEWQSIADQKDIQISWKVYNSSANNRHAVIWKLHYIKAGISHDSSGIYLVSLDDNGLCSYFYYVGEEK